jgi:hypothetical protein
MEDTAYLFKLFQPVQYFSSIFHMVTSLHFNHKFHLLALQNTYHFLLQKSHFAFLIIFCSVVPLLGTLLISMKLLDPISMKLFDQFFQTANCSLVSVVLCLCVFLM